MNETLRNDYLETMQITRWLPRVALPFAKPSNSITNDITSTQKNNTLQKEEISAKSHLVTKPITEKPVKTNKTTVTIEQTPLTQPTATTEITPHFSLQLMQAGPCLLLVELVTGKPFQINDPTYQLLRNILKAANLPDSPQYLGDIIHWPLFKQSTIPQGTKEAQEFLQSYLTTHQEQLPTSQCLWLIGLSAIHFVTGLDEQNYYQTPTINPVGNTLLSPSLELLIEQPKSKALLWQTIKQLIPTWQV